jgi:hypothetical protein
MGDVRVCARNGNLVGVTAVAHVLPRYWDGRRLLRFLTGLAMLALAFTVHVTPPAPELAAPAPPASAPSAPPASALPAAVAESAPSNAPSAPASAEPVASLPAWPVETPTVLSTAILLLLVGGLALRVRAERAPPGV